MEELLKNYKMMKISIKNLEKEIEFIKGDITLDGISYDEVVSSPTNKINSVVEDKVLAKSEKIHFKERCIQKNKKDIDAIDRSLKGLEEVERIVVVEKYINNRQWWQVAMKVKYSERQCRNIRKDAIDKLVKGIYG